MKSFSENVARGVIAKASHTLAGQTGRTRREIEEVLLDQKDSLVDMLVREFGKYFLTEDLLRISNEMDQRLGLTTEFDVLSADEMDQRLGLTTEFDVLSADEMDQRLGLGSVSKEETKMLSIVSVCSARWAELLDWSILFSPN